MIDNSICDINFENLENQIRIIFSTNYLLNCYKTANEFRYREIFEDKKIKKLLTNTDMLRTIHNFFENSLNLTQTSQNSFMHRNTVIYRLEKIKKITGLNIKVFEDAVIFDNLLLVYKQLYSK